MDDDRMMEQALEQARLALEDGDVPVGAVVARDGEVIAVGRNRREAECDPTAHAEIVAIRAAARALGARRLTGCTLYATLEPCPMCAGAIVMAGLSRLKYGARDAEQGCAGSVYRITEDPAFAHYCPADGGLREADCRALLSAFFRKARAKERGE